MSPAPTLSWIVLCQKSRRNLKKRSFFPLRAVSARQFLDWQAHAQRAGRQTWPARRQRSAWQTWPACAARILFPRFEDTRFWRRKRNTSNFLSQKSILRETPTKHKNDHSSPPSQVHELLSKLLWFSLEQELRNFLFSEDGLLLVVNLFGSPDPNTQIVACLLCGVAIVEQSVDPSRGGELAAKVAEVWPAATAEQPGQENPAIAKLAANLCAHTTSLSRLAVLLRDQRYGGAMRPFGSVSSGIRDF